MTNDKKKVPALWLEQAALGELSDASRVALESRVAPEELNAQRAALTQANQETLRELPSRRLVDAITRRSQRSRRQDRSHQWMSVAWSTASALSIVALLVVLYDDYSTVTPGDVAGGGNNGLEETRVKGLAPHLVIYRKRGDSVERLMDGAKARAGDELQVAYVAARQAHGVVVSIDGAAATTMHLSGSGQSVALNAPRETLLAESYRLDAAPAFERFFLVTADHAFDASQVERAAAALAIDHARARSGLLALPPDLQQSAFTVIKVLP